jgi:hypothetical protein
MRGWWERVRRWSGKPVFTIVRAREFPNGEAEVTEDGSKVRVTIYALDGGPTVYFDLKPDVAWRFGYRIVDAAQQIGRGEVKG